MGGNILVLLLLFPSSWSEMESQFEDRMGEKNTSSSYLEMAGIRCASNCDSLAIINTAWDYFRPRLRANNSLLFECRVAGSFIFILQYRICVVVVLTYSSCDACPDPNPRNQQRLDSGCSVLFLDRQVVPVLFLIDWGTAPFPLFAHLPPSQSLISCRFFLALYFSLQSLHCPQYSHRSPYIM